MFENNIIALFENQIVLTNNEIKSKLNIEKGKNAHINTEIKRLCDKNVLKRIGRGIYIKIVSTELGESIPSEDEITYAFYMAGDKGYLTDAAYYNSIGLSVTVPDRRRIVSNEYSSSLDVISHTDIIKPRIPINKENIMYLQLLDAIYYFPKNHKDMDGFIEALVNQLKTSKLDDIKLILMAKNLYPRFVLDFVLEMEDLYHDEYTFNRR